MKVEEKHMQTCTQEHIYFNGLSRIIPMYHVAILQKSSTYFCKSEIEKKKSINNSYYFTANHLKSSVDIIWLYSQRNSSLPQD